ncbi:MAG: helix-turn-helix transcriptional regulator [Thermodesulfobacteriota bacterium]
MKKKSDSLGYTYEQKIFKILFRLMSARRELSLTELAEELECEKSTVSRLFDNIRMTFGDCIVENKKSRQKYFRMIRPRELKPLPLSINELTILEMCKTFTSHLLGEEQLEEASNGLLKTQMLLPNDASGPPGGEFACFNPGSIDYTHHQETLKSLLEAIGKKRVCEITYQSIATAEPSTYCIMPLKIFSHKDTVYVHACRSDKKGVRKRGDTFFPVLPLHRFKKATILPATFEIPKDYSFEKQFTQSFGVIKDKVFRVKLEVWDWAAGYVAERIYSANQQLTKLPDGKVHLEFDASSPDEVLSWVLSLKEKARILEPVDLKNQMAGKLRAMLGLYAS